MSDLALTTADKINVGTLSIEQETGVAAEAITAGAPVLYDANGKLVKADANAVGLKGCIGLATHTVAAGGALTVIRRGLVDGIDVSALAAGASVYVSDTAGLLGTTVGTATVYVGRVVPIWGAPLGTACDKALYVECTGTGASA